MVALDAMGRVKLREHQLRVSKRTVSFVDEGAGDPIVFLHPMFVSWEIYRPILTSLLDNFRVIAVDFPGFGNSEEFPFRHSLARYSDFLVQFTDSLGIRKVSIFGTSLGGTVGFVFADQHPDRVKTLIVQGAPYYNAELGISPRDKTLFQIAKRAPFRERFLHFAVTRKLFWFLAKHTDANLRQAVVEAGDEQILQDFKHLSPRAVIELGEEVLNLDLRDRLSSLLVPVGIIAGEDDKIVPPESAQKLATLLPDAKLELVPGEDHELIVDNPQVLTELVRRFLLGV